MYTAQLILQGNPLTIVFRMRCALRPPRSWAYPRTSRDRLKISSAHRFLAKHWLCFFHALVILPTLLPCHLLIVLLQRNIGQEKLWPPVTTAAKSSGATPSVSQKSAMVCCASFSDERELYMLSRAIQTDFRRDRAHPGGGRPG